MSKDLSKAWLDEEDDIVETEETVHSGSESPYIQGYGAYDVKITMAKVITFPKKKVEFIELDFVNKEGKTLTEKFMVRGSDGKTFFVKNKVKTQHFGINKIKSLLKVANVYPDVEPKKLMAALYGNTEEADVTYTAFGKEKTEEFTVFNDLIDVKVKICVSSKKENSQTSREQDDKDEQKYVDACIKNTKAYIKANPKKKSIKKFDDDEADYVNTYRWFTISSVSHFCSIDGLFSSELESKEEVFLKKFLESKEEGTIYEGRTLICDDMTEKELARLGINEYGKRVEPEESEDDGYDEPEVEPEEDEDEDW